MSEGENYLQLLNGKQLFIFGSGSTSNYKIISIGYLKSV